MKHEEMLSLIRGIFNKVESIHTEGQKEYAMNENNVFANFQRITNQTNIDQKNIIHLLLKKMYSNHLY